MAGYTTYRQAETKIADLEEFQGNNWRATTRGDDVYFGNLEGQALRDFQTAWSDRTLTYVVMSYYTPIAWVLEDGTRVIPDAHYSQTTTRQQKAVRRAWNMEV